MEVKDAKSLKIELSMKIEKLVAEYQSSTGLVVSRIDVIQKDELYRTMPSPIVVCHVEV